MASWRTLEVTGRVSGGSCRHARTLEWVIDSQKGRGAAWKDEVTGERSDGSSWFWNKTWAPGRPLEHTGELCGTSRRQ